MKRLNFMNVKEQQFSSEEMKDIMAGSGSCSGSCHIACIPCYNPYCQGSAPDCSYASALPICGPGGDYTCTCS